MIEQYYVKHRTSGEIYAVRAENGIITETNGPLYYEEVTAANLAEGFDTEPDESCNGDEWQRLEAPDYPGDQA